LRKVKVNLTKYVATEAGLRYCPAVITSNGRIKHDIVLVGGKEERHPEGAYYLDWRRNGVRVRLSVGKNAQDALTQRDRKTFELNAANHGVVVQSEVRSADGTNGDGRKPLSVAVEDFLEGMKLSRKPKTHAAYKTALNYFTESCPKLYVEDIERRDMLKFAAFLRDEKEPSPTERSPASVCNLPSEIPARTIYRVWLLLPVDSQPTSRGWESRAPCMPSASSQACERLSLYSPSDSHPTSMCA